MPTQSEMTAHLRKVVAKQGVRARVRKTPAGHGIQVFPPAYGVEFTEAEQRAIRFTAQANGLTLVRGLPIDVERMTDPHGMEFFIGGAA